MHPRCRYDTTPFFERVPFRSVMNGTNDIHSSSGTSAVLIINLESGCLEEVRVSLHVRFTLYHAISHLQ